MQRLVSTMLTPQPRPRDASFLTYSSVNVQRGSRNVLCASALESAAGTCRTGASKRADGNIEATAALLAQLGDGNNLADFHAALEFHAHLPEDFDLGVHDLLSQTEARDAEHEHAAGNRIAVEHGHGEPFSDR